MGKCANALFAQIISHFVPFSKLNRGMSLFCNLIFGQSSYNKLKIKKKKNCWNLSSMNSSSMQFFKALQWHFKALKWRFKTCIFFFFFFFKSDRSIGSPIVAFFMELELHELEFHANFFFVFLSFTYSGISWRPIVAFFMELQFHAIIIIFLLFFFKFDRSILDFLQIEFYIETQF